MGIAQGGLADTLSDRHHGPPKCILSFRGVSGTAPMGWTGEAERLEFQNRKSVETTMHDRRAFTDQETNDLATFLRSLSPIPVKRIDDPTILKGAKIFERLDCESCHCSPLCATSRAYEIGFMDERGDGSFNPPSLRGVKYRSSLLLDGRASSFEDFSVIHEHQLQEELHSRDLVELLALLW